MPMPKSAISFFFFFNDTATTEIYTLSLHDALPICDITYGTGSYPLWVADTKNNRLLQFSTGNPPTKGSADRKSTRLNSSHLVISYAVFCLKKKKQQTAAHIPLPISQREPDAHNRAN